MLRRAPAAAGLLKDSACLQSGRIGADEAINDTEGKESQELEELLNEKEAKTRAILLEMVSSRQLASTCSQPATPTPVCVCVCRWATSLMLT